MSQSRLSFAEASQSLLDAAIDPSRWTDAMDMIARYAGGTGSVLLQVRGRAPGTPHSASLAGALDTYFRDGWHLRDERVRGLPLVRARGIAVDQDFASREEIESSDYYCGLLGKFDLRWSAIIGFSSAEEEWCLVVQRGDGDGAFDADEQADLVRFAPHLNQSALLARNLAYANASGMVDACQSLGCASFLLDQFGRVIRHNALAEHLIGDGLDLACGKLRCGKAFDSLALNALVSAATAQRPKPAVARLPAVVVQRPTKRPLVVQAVELTGLARAAFSPAKAMLLVTDLDSRPPATSVDLLRSVFKLTATEAALVNQLQQDAALSVAAETMGISLETARSHLKRVFSKTGTNRQAELLLLIRRLISPRP